MKRNNTETTWIHLNHFRQLLVRANLPICMIACDTTVAEIDAHEVPTIVICVVMPYKCGLHISSLKKSCEEPWIHRGRENCFLLLPKHLWRILEHSLILGNWNMEVSQCRSRNWCWRGLCCTRCWCLQFNEFNISDPVIQDVQKNASYYSF